MSKFICTCWPDYPYVLHEQRFMELLNGKPGKDEIIAMVTELEERIRR